MDKKIQWLKWEDPLIPKNDSYNQEEKFHKDSFKDFDEIDDRHVRTILGPYGVIPLNENSITGKLYKLWVGHCNFDITESVKRKIEEVDGVEILRIWTRYRFWLGIGNLFEDYNVQKNIEEKLIKKEKNQKNSSIKALIKVLSKKYKFWIIYSDVNGELKTIGGEDIDIVKSHYDFNNNLNILACSWEND